jgi:hypothetical protein
MPFIHSFGTLDWVQPYLRMTIPAETCTEYIPSYVTNINFKKCANRSVKFAIARKFKFWEDIMTPTFCQMLKYVHWGYK